MSQPSTTKQTRLDGLQWGRALAALLVVVCHAILHPLPEAPPVALYLGDVGVTIFFIISGFIMVTTTGRGRFDPLLFMRRRIIRVVPLYYLATVVVVFFALFLPTLMKSTQFDFQHLVLSLLFVPTYTPSTGALLPIYKLGWTLNFEMFFYLVFAIMSFMSLRLRVVAIVGVFGLLAVLGMLFKFDNAVLDFYTYTDILAFAAGVVLAYVKDWRHWTIRPVTAVAALIGGALMIVGVFALYGSMRQNPLAHIVAILACTALVGVLAACESGGDGRVSRFAVLLGDASYSIYLSHIFVVAGVWWVAERLLGQIEPLSYAATLLAALIASVAVGVVIHLSIEKPMTRVLNSVFGRSTSPVAAAS